MNELIASESIQLDSNNLISQGNSVIDEIVKEFKLPREILPTNSEIGWAINSLPRELNMISPQLRGEFIAKACIASSVGLFDGAIVYVWNSVVTELKDKVRAFGLEMIKQISNSGKSDNFLEEIKDYELIELCYQLNILNKEGRYYLQQCRDIRNNASIAHPTTIKIDDRELINFISRCCKYGLSASSEVVGIDIKSLNVILSGSGSEDSIDNFVQILQNTFKAQQVLVYKILYSNFIDSSKSSEVRSNAIEIAKKSAELINENPDIILSILEKHNQYLLNGTKDIIINSRRFIVEIGQGNSLTDSEKISTYDKAIKNLQSAHFAPNNFYNEPPFAERLLEVSEQIIPIPEEVISSYLIVNLYCFLGNSYGVSWNAVPFCERMLKGLTPKGIEYLIAILHDNTEFTSSVSKKDKIKELLTHYENSGIANDTQKLQIKALKAKII